MTYFSLLCSFRKKFELFLRKNPDLPDRWQTRNPGVRGDAGKKLYFWGSILWDLQNQSRGPICKELCRTYQGQILLKNNDY